MKSISLFVALAALNLCAAGIATADEMDHDPRLAPQGVLVRVNPVTNQTTLYKAEKIDPSLQGNTAMTLATIQQVAQPQNILNQVVPQNLTNGSELDRDHSTSAWFYDYYGDYWTPGTYFNYYTTPYYYTTYSWAYPYTWGGYNWYFYW